MANELYNLIPDAFTILSTSYEKIASLGTDVVSQENSPRQKKTIDQLVAATKFYRAALRHITLNDAGTAVIAVENTELSVLNDILTQLKRVVNRDPIPVYPTPISTNTFNFGDSASGFDLSSGVSGDLIVHNGTSWVNLNKGLSGEVLVSTSTGLQWQSVVGNGVPSGGSTGQVLMKTSNTDYIMGWATLDITDISGITASAVEINKLDGANWSTSESNTLVGINTGVSIQSQIDGKQSSTLTDGYFFVGQVTNLAGAVAPSGDVTFDRTGLFAITAGSIVDADVNTSAAIGRNKLANGSSNRLVINSSLGVMTDASAITASRVLISDANGIPTASSVTAAILVYLDATSSIQTQLDAKLPVTLSSVTEGDVIYYNGSAWANLAVGSSGQVLTSNGTTVSWQNGVSNGIPSGGTTHQYLRKASNTNYDTEWNTLVIADISDISATADEINILSGVTGVSSTEITYLDGVTSSIQTQLSNKLDITLNNHSLFVGGAGNTALQLAAGVEGSVFTIVSGHPTWQTPPTPGNVSGPVSTTDNAIARWNGTDGTSIQNSGVIIDDSNNVTGIANTTFATGSSIRTSTSSSDTLLVQAYDVDGAAYTTFITLTAANTPTMDMATSVTIGGNANYYATGTDVALADGGTGESLSDPGDYKMLFWNDATGHVEWLGIGTNLTLSGSSPSLILNATGGGTGGHVIEDNGTPLTDRANINIYNGLTASDNDPDTDIVLGGTLTQNTTINGDSGTYNLSFTNIGTFTASAYTGPSLTVNSSSGGLSASSSAIAIATDGTISLQYNSFARTFRLTSTGTELDLGSDATGDIYYRNGSGKLTRRGIGSEGQILAVSSGIPAWITNVTQYTDEMAQDAVGNILTNTTTIDFTYIDGSDQISASVNDNSISNAKIRQSAGLSVIGRSANTTGNVDDITGTDGQILRVSGTSLGFGTIGISSITMNTARLLGRTTASSGAVEEISMGAGLSLSGGTLSSTLSFGTQYQVPSTNSTTDDYDYGHFRFDPTNNTLWGAGSHTISGTQTITWGNNLVNAALFGTALFGEDSEITSAVGAGLGVGEQIYIAAYGGSAFGRSCKVGTSGIYAQIGGWYAPSAVSGKTNLKVPQVNAPAAWGFYETNASQTDNHGVNAEASAVLGGLNPDIPSSSPRTVILGGNGIKARSSAPDQVYMPSLNIVTTPSNDDTLTQVMVRDDSTSGGPIKYRNFNQQDVSTVAGLGSAATAGKLKYCSNETGGATLVFSDGTNWRRVQDLAIAS